VVVAAARAASAVVVALAAVEAVRVAEVEDSAAASLTRTT